MRQATTADSVGAIQPAATAMVQEEGVTRCDGKGRGEESESPGEKE